MEHEPIRVAVVDDHPLFRQGISTLLDTLEGIESVGDAATIDEAIAVVDRTSPHVVLMDLDLGGESGIDATRTIVRRFPGTAVLVLTMLGDDRSLFNAMRAGARGYLLKVATPEEVHRAVRSVAGGAMLFGREIADHAVAYFSGPTDGASPRPFPSLTEREREVLDLVARGHDNQSIARTLFLSSKTVRNYVYAIMTKLDVSDRSALIVTARQAGLGGEQPSDP